MAGHRGRRARPARSATSVEAIETTPRVTATAWCGRSSATASASSSTPTCRSSTTTTRTSTTVMRPGMTFTIEPMITLGHVAPRHVGRRLDRGHRRRQAHRAVRAHDPRHRRRRRGAHRARRGQRRLARAAHRWQPLSRRLATSSAPVASVVAGRRRVDDRRAAARRGRRLAAARRPPSSDRPPASGNRPSAGPTRRLIAARRQPRPEVGGGEPMPTRPGDVSTARDAPQVARVVRGSTEITGTLGSHAPVRVDDRLDDRGLAWPRAPSARAGPVAQRGQLERRRGVEVDPRRGEAAAWRSGPVARPRRSGPGSMQPGSSRAGAVAVADVVGDCGRPARSTGRGSPAVAVARSPSDADPVAECRQRGCRRRRPSRCDHVGRLATASRKSAVTGRSRREVRPRRAGGPARPCGRRPARRRRRTVRTSASNTGSRDHQNHVERRASWSTVARGSAAASRVASDRLGQDEPDPPAVGPGQARAPAPRNSAAASA